MEKQPYRVLQVVATMNRGGTETMLMNHFRALDRSKVQFDFIVHYPFKNAYDEEIKSLGGRIFIAPKIRPWTYFSYFSWLDRFFQEHACEYVAVHSHIQENSGFVLYYAKKYGINFRLASSHIAPVHLDYKYIFREFARIYLNKSVTTRLACGNDAGKHLFKNKSFQVMHNAIDSNMFKYDESTRTTIRKQLNLDDNCFVIGNVGRFGSQKNHNFIIDVFEVLTQKYSDVKLLLVGDGGLMDKIKNQVAAKGIDDKVMFLGVRNDINKLLQAFDVFFMPSLYEGLPVSVIEAQAAGLPCLLSDTIDKETDITGNIKFLSLKTPISIWVDELLKLKDFKRFDTSSSIKGAGYDVAENLKLLIPLYGIKS